MPSTGNNNTNGSPIPNSGNLSNIVADMMKMQKFANDIVPIIVDFSKSIKSISKINTKELRANTGQVKDISRSIDVFIDSIGYVVDSLKKLDKSLNLKDVANIRNKLMTTETGGETVVLKNIQSQGDGSLDMTREITKAKISNPGLIDIIAQVANLSNIMTSLKFANPIMVKLKFNQTLKLFSWQYKKLTLFTSRFDSKTIRDIKYTTDGLQQVMLVLPGTVSSMADLFSKYGKTDKVFIWMGIGTLLGKKRDGSGGVVGAILILGEKLSHINIDVNKLDELNKSLKKLGTSINIITGSFSLIGILGPLVWLGVGFMFGFGKGKNGGIMTILLNNFEWIAKQSKNLKDANKALVYISLVVLTLSAAVTLLVLTGILITQGMQQILMVGAMLGFLVGAFMIIGFLTKVIGEGTKSMLYIAATVGILAITAVLLVTLGQFIEAEWQSILQIGAMLGFLVAAFVIIGLFAKRIGEGTKSMLWIALTVGILAGIAVLLVWISNYIEGRWESILQIGLMVLILTAPFIAVGLLHKQLEKGIIAMALVLGGIIALTICIGMIAHIANTTDTVKMWSVVGMMGTILTGVAAIIIGLGAMVMGPQALLLAAGAGALVLLIGSIAALTKVTKELVKLAVVVDTFGYTDPAELNSVLKLPLEAFLYKGENGKDKSIFDLMGEISVRKVMRASLAMNRLSKIVGYLTNMALNLQTIATLNMPTEWDKDGKPTKFQPMGPQDFINASTNSATILRFFTVLFSDKKHKLPNGVIVGGIMKDINNIEFGAKTKVKRLSKIVRSVGTMATTLRDIASLNIPIEWDENGNPKKYRSIDWKDFESASMNASGILQFFCKMFSDNKQETVYINGAKVVITTITSDYLDNISRSTKNKIERLGVIVSCIGGMVNTIRDLASLNVPIEWDENGNPKRYVQIGPDQIRLAGSNMTMIMTGMMDTLTGFYGNDKSTQKATSNKIKSINKIIDDLTEVMTGATGCVDSIISVYKNNLMDIKEDDLVSKYKSAVSVMDNLISTLGGQKVHAKNAGVLHKNIQETNNLVTKINSVDVDKLKTAADLMSNISKLSQSIRGDFNKLAEAINKDLLEALTKLTEAMDGINNKDFTAISTPAPTSVNQVISKPSGSAGVKDKKEALAKPTTPPLTKADIDQITKAIKELTSKVSMVIQDRKVQVQM